MGDRRDDRSNAGSDSGSDVPEKKRETIPDAVDHFLGQLNDCLKVRDVQKVHSLYEDTYNKITDKHYKNKSWPKAEAVADQLNIEVKDDPLFIILYKDLYYRHIYTKLTVNYDDRRASWENYCKLLELFVSDLHEEKTLSVGLPAQWLWDILDEFVYHFQTYSQYRAKTARNAGKEAEIQLIKEHPDVFDTTKVLSYLHQLVRESLVEEWLKEPHNPDGKAGAFTDEMVRNIGYFAMMQLLRMHSMLGDYQLSLKTVQRVDFHVEVPLFYKTAPCHVTLYYYMGFAYMMQRRYVDAVRTFSSILVYLSKTTTVNQMSYQYDFMMKKQDQMYALLLICLTLCPQPVDESLEKVISNKDGKHAEKAERLQRGEELCFEELFSYACPKFVGAAPPDFENLDSFNANESHQRQLKLFLQEVKQQQALPKIGAYMKLYTSLQTPKLALLCEMDEEGLRDQLMCVMHKTRQLVHKDGTPPIEGELQPCSEVEFYLDGQMVHINSHKPTRPHADIFLEHILKFQDILKKMDAKP